MTYCPRCPNGSRRLRSVRALEQGVDFMLTGKLGRCSAAAGAVIALAASTPMGANAVSDGPITGGYTVTKIASNAAPMQMVTGVDGTVWFLTAKSELGTIATNGDATLTGIFLPQGTYNTADLVSAGPEGEWAFTNVSLSGGCVVSLVEPDGHVLQRSPNHPPNPDCSGAARDANGNLWVSLHGDGSSGLAEITPSGVITVTQAPLLQSAVALGSDGALWTFERVDSNPTFTFSYGRFVPGGSVTTVPVYGTETPPVPGSPFGLLVRPNEDALLARPDGSFWLTGYNVALSSPDHWFIRFLFKGESGDAETADGSLWNVSRGSSSSLERIQRIDEWGVVDHGAALPMSPSNGKPLTATGTMVALQDGSLLFAATDGSSDFIVRYVPTALPRESVWLGSGGDGKWSNPANWEGGLVPENGSVVVLRGSGTMTDDIPSLQPQQIVGSGTVVLAGDPLTVGPDGIQVSGSSTNVVIDNSITVPAGSTLGVRADPFATATLNGVISGAGGVTLGSSTDGYGFGGLVVLTANNTYTGTTVVQDTAARIDGHQPGSAVIDTNFGELAGGGTIGALKVDGTSALDFADEATDFDHCPQTLTVDGTLLFEAGAYFSPAIQACGTPAVQTVGSVLVTGAATISKNVTLFLGLDRDKPQLACLLSTQGALQGQFAGVKEGSTQPDPAGGKVVFSYDTQGGAGCFLNAFTAKTGVH
jgi:hypothetical protein